MEPHLAGTLTHLDTSKETCEYLKLLISGSCNLNHNCDVSICTHLNTSKEIWDSKLLYSGWHNLIHNYDLSNEQHLTNQGNSSVHEYCVAFKSSIFPIYTDMEHGKATRGASCTETVIKT